jgi:hypothetical protein
MSTTNNADERFVNGLIVVLGLVVLIALFMAMCVGPQGVWAAEVSYRNAGGAQMSPTPVVIGTASGRIDLYLHNDADSIDDVVCGYNNAPLSLTPGPTSGDKLNPGEGKHMCVFADQIVRCMSLGSASVFFDESRMVTPTPTP